MKKRIAWVLLLALLLAGSPDFDPNRALRQVQLGDTSDPVFK